MSLTLCSESLSGCSGCESTLLDTGDGSFGLLSRFEILHMPFLMDHKYSGWWEDAYEVRIPKARIGIITGAIANEKQLIIAEEMRRQCDLLIALGTCAAYGGIPALINLYNREELFQRCYGNGESTDSAPPPSQVVPYLLERTFALDEKVVVDFTLPGCPPHPDRIASFLESVIEGKSPEWPTLSVCDDCPAKREGKGSVQRIRRFFRNVRCQTDKPASEMRCLLEQGYLCMGPVTLAGCAGMHGGVPRCIEARVPCRGCHGPVQKDGNQLLDMLNALASNGIDMKNLPDRLMQLRFSGAHGRLNRRNLRKAG